MKCLVCNQRLEFYFSKTFNQYGLEEVQYEKCPNCGFVGSKTHKELNKKDWAELNFRYHEEHRGNSKNPDDPNWVARLESQATLIKKLSCLGLFSKQNPWLDYACGDGKLVSLLNQKGISFDKFDLYMDDSTFLTLEELEAQKFSLIINTSMFEHILSRKSIDYLVNLLDGNGILALHTLICEEVPCDPSWFYLLPVHTAFFTNKSMEILFKEWGFKSSIYSPQAQMWFFLKRKKEEYIQSLAQQTREETVIVKDAFVDYWKKKPYRG